MLKNWPRCPKTLHWQKAVPAHHHALRDQYHAPADSTQNIGSCSPAHGLANNMAFAASFNFVSTHTAPTFPYILVCSAVILEHFRWRTFRDFYNCLLLLALYYPELAQSHFQPTLTLLESTIHIGGSFRGVLSIRASIKRRYPSPCLTVVDKTPFGEVTPPS